MKGTTKILLADLGIVVVLTAVFSGRLIKNYHRKKGTANAYMIQNFGTGNVIRPFNAKIEDGNRVIQYPPKNWECTTWQFIELEENEFILKNLYTQKSFQPLSDPQEGVALFQAPMNAVQPQRWEFLKVEEETADEKYFIRLKGTQLYITPSSNEINASLVLKEKTNNENQKWILVAQTPIV